MFGFLDIVGNHAKTFLQGQITANVEALETETSLLACHCNVKGRVLFNFVLSKIDNGYRMKMPLMLVQHAKTRLEKFSIFSQVEIRISKETDNSPLVQDGIERGFTTLYPETSGLFTPHELQFDKWGLIDFKKGCYTGQEIIARMEYLGKLKKQLCLSYLNLPIPPLRAYHCYDQEGASELGTLVDFHELGEQGYAVLFLMDISAIEKPWFYPFQYEGKTETLPCVKHPFRQ